VDVYKCQVGQLEKRIAIDSKEKEAELEALVVKLHQKTEVSFAMNLRNYFIVSQSLKGNLQICAQKLQCYYELSLSAW